jgi:hypothetical protein
MFLVALARERVQQHRRPDGMPLLLGSRLADRLKLAQSRFGELQATRFLGKGIPIKHNRCQMYWFLENDHLVTVKELLGGSSDKVVALPEPDQKDKK